MRLPLLFQLRYITLLMVALSLGLAASNSRAYQFLHADLPIKITQERIGEAMHFGSFTVSTMSAFMPKPSGNVHFYYASVSYNGESVLRFDSGMGSGDDDPKTKSGDLMIFRGACKDGDTISLVFSESFAGSGNGAT
ncbi:MAG: hypothetical protein ACPGPF_08165, partial [Pontibacterium sp.]